MFLNGYYVETHVIFHDTSRSLPRRRAMPTPANLAILPESAWNSTPRRQILGFRTKIQAPISRPILLTNENYRHSHPKTALLISLIGLQMPQTPPPPLSDFTSRMADNLNRNLDSVEMMTNQVDELLGAVSVRDWRRLDQAGGKLKKTARDLGYHGVSACAQSVCRESAKPDNEVSVKRSMIRLIGTLDRSTRT